MTPRMMRSVQSALVVVAASVMSVVIVSGGANAMPLLVGITSSDGNKVVTVQSIEPSMNNDDLACLTAACVVPVGTLTEGHLHRLHLVPADVGQIGFVAYLDGHAVVVDGVERLETPTVRWSGHPYGLGFTTH